MNRNVVTPVRRMPYHATRVCHTGVTFYQYYHGDKQIGNATVPCVPKGTYYLDWDECQLLCDVDMDMTVYPGVSREIIYGDRGERNMVHSRIVYQESGHHTIYLEKNRYDVHYEDGTYYIYGNGSPVAYMTVNSFGTPYPPEQRLTLHTKNTISKELAVLLLSFPLLQISW